MKIGTQATTFERRSSHTNLKWTWKGKKPNLLATIAFNKKRATIQLVVYMLFILLKNLVKNGCCNSHQMIN